MIVMEKRIYVIGIVYWLCLMSLTANAQQTKIAKQRLALDEAISTIEDYEAFATIADEEIRYSFENLFVNGDAGVYNDLLGISKGKTLTVKDYSKKLCDGLRNKKVIIKNIKKEGIWYENGLWRIKFSFDKNLSYTNTCGVLLSSSDFYNKDYHLEATLVYDEITQKCKIESITGIVDSQKELSEDYFAFKTEDKRDQQLTYRNQRLTFNSYGQALIDGSYDKNAFRYLDPDVELIPVLDDCNNVSMRYKSRKMRLKVHYDLGMGETLDLADADGLNSHSTSTNSMGVELGYVFPSKSNIKTGLFFGLGLSKSTIEMSYHSSDYYYNTNTDVDGDSYIRHYSGFKLSQKAKLTELVIPVYADINIKLHQLASLYFDIGIKTNLDVGHENDNTEGNAYIYGIYPQYDNLRMDDQWGYNGFGNKSFTNTDLDNSELTGVSNFTADAFGGIGLRFNIPSTPLSIDAGANYLLGLMDIAKNEKGKIELTNITSSPLVYNTVIGQNNTEHVHNLSETFSKIKRKSFRLSIGVIYKF